VDLHNTHTLVSKADVMTPGARDLRARSLPILKRDSIYVIVFRQSQMNWTKDTASSALCNTKVWSKHSFSSRLFIFYPMGQVRSSSLQIVGYAVEDRTNECSME
jgi:hypothetical protein